MLVSCIAVYTHLCFVCDECVEAIEHATTTKVVIGLITLHCFSEQIFSEGVCCQPAGLFTFFEY